MSKQDNPNPAAKTAAKIAFVGAGNMARSLIGGLLKRGYPADCIACSARSEASLQAAAQLGGITTSLSNADIVENADVVILAVKPQVMADVVRPLREILSKRKPLLISVAAGIPYGSLQVWAGETVPLVRCMPNTPSLLQAGASGLYANANVSASLREQAEAILSAVGIVVWVAEESNLDAVTAVSGSGPAYFFLFMEAMQAAGEQLGLTADAAKILTQQTALGAAQMAQASDVDVAELRRRVTSPNGTTQAAIESLEANDLRGTVGQALRAAYTRSEAIAKELG